MNYKYIIAGDGNMAVAVHSGMNWMDFAEYVRVSSKKLHPKGRDRVFRLGGIELVNPIVYSPSEFADHLPHLLFPA